MTKIKVKDPELQKKLEKTLFVGRSSSSCGNCGRPAFPHDETHAKIAGWGPEQTGCEIKWEYVTSTYVGEGLEDSVRKMRPDLKFYDFMGIYTGDFGSGEEKIL